MSIYSTIKLTRYCAIKSLNEILMADITHLKLTDDEVEDLLFVLLGRRRLNNFMVVNNDYKSSVLYIDKFGVEHREHFYSDHIDFVNTFGR